MSMAWLEECEFTARILDSLEKIRHLAAPQHRRKPRRRRGCIVVPLRRTGTEGDIVDLKGVQASGIRRTKEGIEHRGVGVTLAVAEIGRREHRMRRFHE